MSSSPLVSSDVLWHVVRNGTSYSRKNVFGHREHFTVEPNNVLNLHTKRFSGFANDRVVGLNVNGKQQQLKLVNNTSSKPSRNARVYNLRLSKRRAAYVAGPKLSSFRPDIAKPTLRRIARISKTEYARLRKLKQKSSE